MTRHEELGAEGLDRVIEQARQALTLAQAPGDRSGGSLGEQGTSLLDEGTAAGVDVDGFDDRAFEPYLRLARESGVRFTTMAELGDAADHRRALHDLTRSCSADIPERGEFSTDDEYVAQRIEVATFTPDGVTLAMRDGVWIARSATSLHAAHGIAFGEMNRRLGFVDPDGPPVP
ncbi:hypothetical protein AB0C18_17465 [Nonomuraea muscovyensis]|uniref:hypothetical protein n=1 Tax=Nonomuraea muscovyensis TaxID=1124761 RepID=UPI003411B547